MNEGDIAPHEHIGALRCPKCGNDGTKGVLRYVETIECYRKVLGAKDGVLQVDGCYQTGEGYDTGRDPTLECHGVHAGRWCGHTWPVPPWIIDCLDFV